MKDIENRLTICPGCNEQIYKVNNFYNHAVASIICEGEKRDDYHYFELTIYAGNEKYLFWNGKVFDPREPEDGAIINYVFRNTDKLEGQELANVLAERFKNYPTVLNKVKIFI
jgi:hypothetical protein